MIKDLKSSNTGETINPNIVSENIPSGAVTTDKLADASLTTAKLKDSAVTSGKINDGAVNYDKLATALKNLINGKSSQSDLETLQNALTSHTGNTSNPHNVTKSQVGLGNVDNTSDANKPISDAELIALGLKADKTNIPFENIKDENEHNRFVEGSIDTSMVPSQVTITYAKWSLSGTHLMVVIGGEASTNIGTTYLGYVYLPEWILNKIYRLYEASSLITMSSMLLRDKTTAQFSTGNCYMFKTNNRLEISTDNITNSSSGFRIQFDLLIDNA